MRLKCPFTHQEMDVDFDDYVERANLWSAMFAYSNQKVFDRKATLKFRVETSHTELT